MSIDKTKPDLKSTINALLIEIQAGEIELRDDRINQKWRVNLDSFFISKYPVSSDKKKSKYI